MNENPPRKMTAAEHEKERKKREAAWWNKVIVYYLNQMYHAEMDRQTEKYSTGLLVKQMVEYFREQKMKTLQKLTEKQPGELSALELLQRMEAYQEEDSPFRRLMEDLRQAPDSEERLAAAVDRIVEEAPERILSRGRRNAVHIRKKSQAEAPGPEPEQDPEHAEREEKRLFYEMAFLRAVMPPQRYLELFQTLVQQGRIRAPEAKTLPQEEWADLSYDAYVAAHIALPKARDGDLGNTDELFSAACYMLAAYEQKDKPDFDVKKADVRAMELSGSKAFRLYVKQHPGSLIAAAQNTGLEVTGADLTELDRALLERDAVLSSVRDALRSHASGKSAAYHQMKNALDGFVAVTDEPDKQEKDALTMTLAQYVLTEGSPESPVFERKAGLLAAAALRALLPEKDFQVFLKTANARRGPEEQITQRMLDSLTAQPREAAPERAAPEKALSSN